MATLVSSSAQVIENIVRYNADAAKFASLMARAKGWYAVNLDGAWKFGPSKFVGYEGMTAESYLGSRYDSDRRGRVDASDSVMDGRVTESVLRKWCQPIEAGHPLFDELQSALAEFCAAHEKKPNTRARLSTVIGDRSIAPSDPDDAFVDLMVAVFGKLTPAQRGAFKRAAGLR